MIDINFNRCKLPPYAHQKKAVLDLVNNPGFNLYHEMRVGKSKSVTDADCFMFEAGIIDAVVIACPAQVKPVWLAPEFGELKQHVFVSYRAIELDASNEDKLAGYLQACVKFHVLPFIVVSYEFLRQEDAQTNYPKVEKLVAALAGLKWHLVCDEGCALGNWEATQTRALYELRQTASRVTVLDGTPVGNSPLTLYTKFKLLQTKLQHRAKPLLGFREFSHYKRFISVFAPEKTKFKKTIAWKNLDEVTRRGAPYCSRVEAKDVLDMPRMVPGIIQASLSEKSWKVYKDLRDQMVAWVDGKENVIQHAHVKVLRLAQVCGGFLGGFDSDINDSEKEVREVGDEAPKAVLDWLRLRFKEREDFKVVIWVRFRAEIERYFNIIAREFPLAEVKRQYGDVKDYDGELHPKHPFTGAFILIVQQQAAQYGMNFSKADTEVFASQDYNVVTRSQSEVRLQAPDTRSITSVIDLLVTGPQGQKTVTHDIVRSLREKEDLGRRTAARWKQILTET